MSNAPANCSTARANNTLRSELQDLTGQPWEKREDDTVGEASLSTPPTQNPSRPIGPEALRHF